MLPSTFWAARQPREGAMAAPEPLVAITTSRARTWPVAVVSVKSRAFHSIGFARHETLGSGSRLLSFPVLQSASLRLASSSRRKGLTGGRRRKWPTSGTGTPRAAAIVSLTVKPHRRPWQGPMPQRTKLFS